MESFMRKSLLLVAALAAGCGSLDVPDLNDQGVADLRDRPTKVKVNAAAVGLLIAPREDISQLIGYVDILGILGREAYNFDPADPRTISELLESAGLNTSSPFGGAVWQVPYRDIRNGNNLLKAVDAVTELTDEEKNGVRGFAKTMMAYEYLRVINTRDTQGAPIQKSDDPHPLDPIVSKAEMFAYITTLLDEAKTNLAAAGANFTFTLGDGFAGFNDPASFLKFNRALQARVLIYREDAAGALTALGESFISVDPLSPKLALGVYHSYGTGSGDRTNALVSPNLLVHPSLKLPANLEMTAAGTPDLRFVAKTTPVPERSSRDLKSDLAFKIYPTPTTPVPIIRNEELILLRAEASYRMGNLMAAAADLNFIRVQSGGLAARTDLTMDNFVDELLRQRLYSLLFEGGHRWLDMRRFGRIKMLPLDLPTHFIHDNMPIPQEEVDARAAVK
jgi:hypothetical protein